MSETSEPELVTIKPHNQHGASYGGVYAVDRWTAPSTDEPDGGVRVRVGQDCVHFTMQRVAGPPEINPLNPRSPRYTPYDAGPWTICNETLVLCGTGTVAYVGDDRVQVMHRRTRANVLLVRAAPEMLKMLQRVASLLESKLTEDIVDHIHGNPLVNELKTLIHQTLGR